jgi:hypothetical protein
MAAETVDEAMGVDKAAAAAVRTRSVLIFFPIYRTVGLTGGPHMVLIFFQLIQNWLNFKNSKWVPYLAPKIPNFCMQLIWDIVSNFLNCANIQFQTKQN